MAPVEKKSRQEAHEQIRILSHHVASTEKIEGKPNDLIQRIKGIAFFEPIWAQLPLLFSPLSFTGRAREQVRTFSGEGCDIN